MTTEQLHKGVKLDTQIADLTDHIYRVHDYLTTESFWDDTALFKIEVAKNNRRTGPLPPELANRFLPLPQDPKALLELYLTNARAELNRLQTEFDNL